MLLIFASNLANGGAPPPSVQTQIAIAASWAAQPQDSVAPVIPAKLSPALISVDNPPPLEVVQDQRPWDNWWVPSDPAPQLTVKLAQGPPPGWIPGGLNIPQEILSYAGLDAPLIIKGGTLPSVLLAVQVNNPPFGIPAPSLSTISTAWNPPDAQAPVAGKLDSVFLSVSVSNPPPGNVTAGPWVSAVQWAWQPDPAAYQFDGSKAPFAPAKLAPSIIAVPVSSPPVSLAQDERPYDNWWIPPDAFTAIKGRQASPAILNVSSNNPPFGIPPLSARAILEAWQPPPAQAPVANTLNPTLFIPVNNPPNGFPVISATAIQSPPWQWQPPPPQAPIAGVFNPAITVVPPPSQPPYGVPSPSVSEAILAAWVPPDAQAPAAGKLSPALSAVQVNNPPSPATAGLSGGGAAWVDLPSPLPTLPRTPNPAIFAKQGKPSGNSVLSGVFNSWVGEPWPIMWVQADPAILSAPVNFYPGLIPNQGVFGSFGGGDHSAIMWVQAPPAILSVPANNPPFSTPGSVPQSLVNTLASWQPADPAPISSEFAIPASPATATPALSGALNTILSSWAQSDPAPILATPGVILARPGAALLPSAQFVPSGPPDTTGILSTWTPDLPPAPTVARALNPAFEAISNAPGRRPDRFSSILGSWVPPDPAPIVARSLNPTVSAVAVNNPPFSGSATTTPALIETAAWVSADVAISPPQRILPQPPPLPSYIPARRAAISTVVASWIVADQAPILPRFVPQVPVSAPPAFVASSNSASAATIIAAWAPDLVPPIVPRPLQVQGAAPMAATPTAMAFEAIIGSWAEPQSLPIVGSKLAFAAARIDSPPVSTKTLAQSEVVDQWLAPTGLLPALPDLAPPAALAVEVDNPPVVGSYLDNLMTVLTTWTPSAYDPWFTATSLSYSAPPPPPPPGRSIFEALGMSQEGSALRSGIGQISTS